MKRSILLSLLSIVVLFSTVLQPMQSSAAEGIPLAEEFPLTETLENGYVETFEDEFGNKTELEYLIDDNEFRVNTYLNGELIDYSTRVVENGTYSDEIIYNQLLEVEESVSKGTTFNEVNNIETYNVNDFINEDLTTGTISPFSYTLPRPYSFITSKCNFTLNQCGSLHGKSDTSQIQKFMFDFKRDAALSVIATTITIVYGAPIVAVAALLVSLGVGYANAKLTDSLNGYYNATRKRYSYYVVVKSKETLKHNQEQIDVHYYNSRNGKKNTRVKHSASWMSEDAILNLGIIAY